MKISNALFFLALLAIGSIANSQPGTNNFYKDISSIDVTFDINNGERCRVTEDRLATSAQFVLSNTPFRKIDKDSPDILYISVTIVDIVVGGRFIGCAYSTAFEFWRFVNFKGKNNLVTVYSYAYLNTTNEPEDMRKTLSGHVENEVKKIVSRWAAQRD
jgi:hypothetical protein